MLYRLLLFIIIIAFSACSNSNKESAKVETPKEIEIAIPEGVIIKAQSEVDTLKGSPKAYAVGKISLPVFDDKPTGWAPQYFSVANDSFRTILS